MIDYGHPLMFGTLLLPPDNLPLDVLHLAEVAERVGLDVVSLPDHPYWPQRLDTFTLLAAMAERTNRITLFSNVANLPLRPPAALARTAVALDLLSGGRFVLGIGAGSQQLWEGISAEGGPRLSAGESVEALEEAVQVIRSLWGPGPAAYFTGKRYRLDGAAPSPATVTKIPIWLGAYRPRMLRLTGRVGDGWIPSSPFCRPEQLQVGNQLIDEAARESGRSPTAVRRGYNIDVDFSGAGTGFLHGSPRDSAEQLAELTLNHGVSVYLLYRTESADVLRQFAEEVVPAVREQVDAERSRH